MRHNRRHHRGVSPIYTTQSNRICLLIHFIYSINYYYYQQNNKQQCSTPTATTTTTSARTTLPDSVPERSVCSPTLKSRLILMSSGTKATARLYQV
jgi:hypothetical protein